MRVAHHFDADAAQNAAVAEAVDLGLPWAVRLVGLVGGQSVHERCSASSAPFATLASPRPAPRPSPSPQRAAHCARRRGRQARSLPPAPQPHPRSATPRRRPGRRPPQAATAHESQRCPCFAPGASADGPTLPSTRQRGLPEGNGPATGAPAPVVEKRKKEWSGGELAACAGVVAGRSPLNSSTLRGRGRPRRTSIKRLSNSSTRYRGSSRCCMETLTIRSSRRS